MASVTDTTQYTGRVKWFNKKSGYGFVTITDGERSGDDVFVHHSGVRVESEQFKYLVQGEYISFILAETEHEKHKVQAWDVRGINGGMLMCETLNEIRAARQEHNSSKTGDTQQTTQSSHNRRTNRRRNNGRQTNRRIQRRNFDDGPREGEEWLLVRRTSKTTENTER